MEILPSFQILRITQKGESVKYFAGLVSVEHKALVTLYSVRDRYPNGRSLPGHTVMRRFLAQ